MDTRNFDKRIKPILSLWRKMNEVKSIHTEYVTNLFELFLKLTQNIDRLFSISRVLIYRIPMIFNKCKMMSLDPGNYSLYPNC